MMEGYDGGHASLGTLQEAGRRRGRQPGLPAFYLFCCDFQIAICIGKDDKNRVIQSRPKDIDWLRRLTIVPDKHVVRGKDA
jgi:hypothetical protein